MLYIMFDFDSSLAVTIMIQTFLHVGKKRL